MDKIIFATDFSAVSRKILEYAGRMAVKTGAELLAAHALKPPAALFSKNPERLEAWQAAHRTRLEAFVQIPDLAGMQIGCRIAAGSPETSLITLMRNEKADVLVLAKRSKSTLERYFVGSVTERIAAAAPCPVLVVPDAGAQTVHWKPVLCVTDFSRPSKRALEWGLRLAEDHGAEIAVLTAVAGADVENAHKSKKQAVQDAKRELDELLSVYDAPRGTRALVVEGEPADTIVEQAESLGSDLVVIGRRGRSQGDYIGLGSTADAVLKQETVPLAIIP